MEKDSRIKLEQSNQKKENDHCSHLEILFVTFLSGIGLICIVNICPEVPTSNFQIFTIRIRTV